jgi:hypothetical protein
MIWQIQGIEAKDILDITPYNPIVYGFIILLLLSAIYYLHIQNEKKQVYLEKQNDRLHDALEAVTNKLQDIKNHAEKKDITDNHIVSFLEDIKRKLEQNGLIH